MRIRDPRSGMEKIRIWDLEWKKFGSGIQDVHPGSATLVLASQKKKNILDHQGNRDRLFGPPESRSGTQFN
jgi:hypothetical protein